jgi:hypothetical protein
MVFAMTNAMMLTETVQLSQVSQCVGVFAVRCGVPRRRLMRMNFAGI